MPNVNHYCSLNWQRYIAICRENNIIIVNESISWLRAKVAIGFYANIMTLKKY